MQQALHLSPHYHGGPSVKISQYSDTAPPHTQQGRNPAGLQGQLHCQQETPHIRPKGQNDLMSAASPPCHPG